MSLLGSQVTDGAAFGQTGEGTVQILSNMTGARDMLLGTLNNQSLLLGTNNLPRLTIKNDGRIGIGTTSPNQVLSVNGLIESTNGGIKFPDGTTQSTAALGPSQWKITHGGSNYSKARLWEGDSSKFPLDNYSQIVSVHSNSLGYPISTYNTDPAGMSAIAHWIEDTNGLSAGWLLSGINGVSSTGTSWGIPNAKLSAILGRGGDFIIGPVTSNKSLYLLGGGSPQVVVSGNGNVGIGAYSTNLPNARLQVQNGDVYLENIGSGLILKSPSGQCWRITIDDSGNLVRTAITCP
ncbi:MAG: hypothetical protein JST14_00355 [Bacteroidetes bacterium]|nr:hypothetical protein [Bacteroidota bacterium]